MPKKERKPLTTRGRILKEADDIINNVKKIIGARDIRNYVLHVSTYVVRSLCEVRVFTNEGTELGNVLVNISMVDIFANDENWIIAEKHIMKSLGFNNCEKLQNVRKYEFTF